MDTVLSDQSSEWAGFVSSHIYQSPTIRYEGLL